MHIGHSLDTKYYMNVGGVLNYLAVAGEGLGHFYRYRFEAEFAV